MYAKIIRTTNRCFGLGICRDICAGQLRPACPFQVRFTLEKKGGWKYNAVKSRDEDPDPVGSVDFWPAGSGTFFIGSYL